MPLQNQGHAGVSLNDSLLVGPTVHSPLIDVLMFFRSWRIGLVADVSKMYRGIMLVAKDKDLHRYLWRKDNSEPLRDYRMKRVTFGVSSSSFVANMCLKQNAKDFQKEFPLGVMAVERSFYVDDGLTGADDIKTAVRTQKELQELFKKGGFTLHKWNSNDPKVFKHIDPKLRSDGGAVQNTGDLLYTKTLGLQWKADTDQFHVTVSQSPSRDRMTKRQLLSDISRLFDVLGWFSPTIVKVKILQQRLWELGLGWDQPIPLEIENVWRQWRKELPELIEVPIPRCYHPRDVYITSRQLHGFSDASANAYSAVIYLRMIDTKGEVHSSLVTSKTKVAPIKRLTIPRLELCGCVLLARLMTRVREVLGISLNDVCAWTDSTIVLGWLSGSPRRFKTFVGNRVSAVTSQIPPSRWGHVPGVENPADCASRGISPLELITHPLWWKGPDWMVSAPDRWPLPPVQIRDQSTEGDIEVCHVTITLPRRKSIVDVERYSTFWRLRRITAWMMRFTKNTRSKQEDRLMTAYLTTEEMFKAERHLFSIAQEEHFSMEMELIKSDKPLPNKNRLLPLSPRMGQDELLRVGGRLEHSKMPYQEMHPVILHGRSRIT